MEDVSAYFKAISWHVHRYVETTESPSTETSIVLEIEWDTKPELSPLSVTCMSYLVSTFHSEPRMFSNADSVHYSLH